MESASIIHMDNVGVRYNIKKEILRDVNLSINKGDFYFVTGLSGAGKTTLLRLMGLSFLHTRGSLTVFGKDVSGSKIYNLHKIRRRIGVIFQDFKLIDNISVFDNIALPLRIQRVKESLIQKKVNHLLDWVEMSEYTNYYPEVLSGGQQQLVSLCRAVIGAPEILLADEAAANIDYKMQEKLLIILKELNARGTSIVFATHNKEIVTEMKKPVLYIKDGYVKKINQFSQETA